MRSINVSKLKFLFHNAFLYRVCKRYVDHYNGENNDNIHANGEWRFMQKVLPHCVTVFDIGANVGDWTSMAYEINPHLQIHSFEPSAATFRLLEARGTGAICNNFGLSSVSCETMLWVFADGAGINSLYKRQGLEEGWGLSEQQQCEMVRLELLDTYCQRTSVDIIDFVKVDVEGHELEVFKGAADMLGQHKIKRIQFEYGGCNIDSRVLLKDFFDFFNQYGYSLYKIFPDELYHVLRYDQRLENFQYQNWVAVTNEILIRD